MLESWKQITMSFKSHFIGNFSNDAVVCRTIFWSNHSWKIFNPISCTHLHVHIYLNMPLLTFTHRYWVNRRKTSRDKNKLVRELQQIIHQMSAHYLYELTSLVNKTKQNLTMSFICIVLDLLLNWKKVPGNKKQKVIKFHFKHVTSGFLVI